MIQKSYARDCSRIKTFSLDYLPWRHTFLKSARNTYITHPSIFFWAHKTLRNAWHFSYMERIEYHSTNSLLIRSSSFLSSSTRNRQIGHVFRRALNHISTHSEWKWWRQGRTLMSSPSLISVDKHTQQRSSSFMKLSLLFASLTLFRPMKL